MRAWRSRSGARSDGTTTVGGRKWSATSEERTIHPRWWRGRVSVAVLATAALAAACGRDDPTSPLRQARLAFVVQPTATYTGVVAESKITVEARDAQGRRVTGFTGPVTLDVESATSAPALLGTRTVAAVGGVATFADVRFADAGTGLRLSARASGMPSVASAAFSVRRTTLAFATAPGNVLKNSPIAPEVVVQARDDDGNPLAGFVGVATVGFGVNPSAASLAGRSTASFSNGRAVFSDLKVTAPGSGFTLVANVGDLALSATSAPFDVFTGRLLFSVQPSVGSPGAAMVPAVEVRAVDESDNLLTNFTGRVTLSDADAPGGSTRLGGTLTADAVSGVATFTNVAVTTVGTAFRIRASSPGIADALSESASATYWVARAPMRIGRYEFGVAALNGVLYAVGGRDPSGAWLGDVEAYDPATNRWTTRAPLPYATVAPGVGVVRGVLYVVGGYNASSLSVFAYDPATDRWTEKAPLPTPRGALSVAVVGDVLYAIGGDQSYNTLPTVEAYDPATDSWSAKPPMITPREAFGATAVSGLIYAMGGFDWDDNGYGSEVEVFEPTTGRWTSAPSMPTPRQYLAVTSVNSVIYAIGGSWGQAPWRTTVEAFDPARNAWFTGPDLPVGRLGAGAATIGGTIYVVGGLGDPRSLVTYTP